MAIFKADGYSDIRVETGDPELDTEQSVQLKVSAVEILSAINAEGLVDKIFSRILINRRKSFNTLADKIPGAEAAGN